MKKYFLFTLMLTLGFGSLTQAASTFMPHYVWDKKNVRVCFSDAPLEIELHGDQLRSKPWTQEQKKWIRSVVNAAYSQRTTSIHFYGWQNCSPEFKEDIVLLQEDVSRSPWRRLFLGLKEWVIEGEPPKGVAGVYTKPGQYGLAERICVPGSPSGLVWLDTYADANTVLHEFGHAAGLGHEHVRKEAIQDEACAKIVSKKFYQHDKQVRRYKRDLQTGHTVQSGTYDSSSVMSYCHESGKLSLKDRSILNRLYADQPIVQPQSLLGF